MGRFETELLANNENLAALADLSGTWIDRVHDHDPPRRVVLDKDSSVSPTFGEQEGTAYNGHFGCRSAPSAGRPRTCAGTMPASVIGPAPETSPRRVVAKIEWHPGELYPRVGFIVTNLGRPAERVVAFYNQRGTAEQWIKEGKNAIRWTRLSCRRFDHNALRLQLHALAYNLGNFMRTLALPDAVEEWSLTSLREKLIKIGAKIVRHGRYVTFQMAEVVIPRDLFADILRRIDRLRPPPAPA